MFWTACLCTLRRIAITIPRSRTWIDAAFGSMEHAAMALAACAAALRIRLIVTTTATISPCNLVERLAWV
jgi:hypothetical protein